MAITEKELQISNKSYTNKDFEAVYAEAFKYATELSKRYSPKDSNESDPFIVLLKLQAFVTDKVIYNLDKNILERFITSCTQERSMRELTEILGYNMHYYNSAKVELVFKYNFKDTETQDIEIPQYSTVNNGSGIIYTLLEAASISRSSGVSNVVTAIQGNIQKSTVLGNDKVQLENLDNENCIYFPEVMVAENGVIISNSNGSSSTWEKVDNLNTQVYGTNVYKFGYDSKLNLPYLQFPEWISAIIGDGLTIKYFTTLGTAGVVGARELNTLSRISSSDEYKDSDILVYNYSASTKGADIETIDESYQGFKKIVGTYDSLCTCRDYANAIYNLSNNIDEKYVSNIQVSDRRNDINYGCNVITFNGEAATDESIITTVTTTEGTTTSTSPVISAFDLCLYGLKPIKNTNFAYIDSEGGYIDSYKCLGNKDKYVEVISQLDNYQTACHDYKQLQDSDIRAIIDHNCLNAVINTNEKVNAVEQIEIKNNVVNALLAKYNPRNLEFGFAIPFDELLDTMESADSRIKAVSLQEPEHSLKWVDYISSPGAGQTAGSHENNLILDADGHTTSTFLKLVEKNILSGKISALDVDEDFTYKYNYINCEKKDSIEKFTSSVNIPQFAVSTTAAVHTLGANEVIQIMSPSLTDKVVYPYGVNYYLKLNSGENYIPANTEYVLQTGDEAIFEYTDNSNNQVIVSYVAGQILKPKMDWYTSAYKFGQGYNPTKIIPEGDPNGNKYYTLSTNDEVAERAINEETLQSVKKCYWLTNEPSNEIKWVSVPSTGTVDHYEYLLKDDEYFFYSDSTLSSLFSYGSGTLLYATPNCKGLLTEWKITTQIPLDEITREGLSGLKDYFITLRFDGSAQQAADRRTLKLIQNEILTLTQQDSISVINTGEGATSWSLPNNIFEEIPTTIELKYALYNNGSSAITYEKLPDKHYLGSTYNWYVRSILDINAGPDTVQTLVDNQAIVFTQTDGETTVSLASGQSFQFDILIQKNGGQNVKLSYTDLNGDTQYPVLNKFVQETESPNILYYNDDMYKINFDVTGTSFSVDFNLPTITNEDKFIMFYLTNIDNSSTLLTKIGFSAWNAAGTTAVTGITKINVNDMVYSNVDDLDITSDFTSDKTKANMYVLKLLPTVAKLRLYLTFPNTEDAHQMVNAIICRLTHCKLVKGINPNIGKLTDSAGNVLSLMNLLRDMNTNFGQQFTKFFLNADIDNSRAIEVNQSYTLCSVQAFYDTDNIANRWVIPMIDIRNSSITIARSSMK